MAKSITELSPNDVIYIKKGSDEKQRVVVALVGIGNKDYPNQPYFLDTDGVAHWRGSVVIEEVEFEAPKQPKQKRVWGEEFINPDGSRKSFREAITTSKNGKTFKDEVSGLADSSKENAMQLGAVLKSAVMWFPRQFPKIDSFDLENDYRTPTLVGYRAPGINEVERTRFLRTGSSLKMVDNGDGRLPRRFGSFYASIYGVGLVSILVAATAVVIIGIFTR